MNKEPEIISVTDLRGRAREILESAHFRGKHYLVERAGQPMVVVMGIEEYRRFMATQQESAAIVERAIK